MLENFWGVLLAAATIWLGLYAMFLGITFAAKLAMLYNSIEGSGYYFCAGELKLCAPVDVDYKTKPKESTWH